MKTLNFNQNLTDLIGAYCTLHNKFAIYISFEPIDFEAKDEDLKKQKEEIFKACPLLKEICQFELYSILYDNSGILLFDTEDELNAAYDQIVGDDGPTESNPYNGPVRVYALTFHKDGHSMTENT